jgi:hypothetical protein
MIQERAMLANLNISQWTARKHDKSVSAEVDATHNAVDGGRYNKLLIDKKALDPLAKHASQVRNYHYGMTLPWGDNGDRILPATCYMEYMAKMRALRNEGETLVDKFCVSYPALVADARQRLGTMYDANDYPHIDHIKERFGIAVNFMPVPSATDFRVDVSEETLAEIRKNLDAQVEKMTTVATKECWDRLHIAVDRIYVTMGKDKPVFRDSLIENLTDLLSMIPKLNFTGDEGLTNICIEIQTHMIVRPANLRRSTHTREELRVHAERILKVIESHVG